MTFTEPLASKLEDNKNGYVVASVGEMAGEFPYTAFYAKKSYIANNQELLTKFTTAIKKGLDYTMNNDGEKIAEVIKKQFTDTDIKDLSIMINRYKEADVWYSNPTVDEKSFNTLVLLLQENSLIKDQVSYKDLVNNLYE